MSGVPAVRIEGLRKEFGPLVALDGIDLEVAPGSMLAILGPSGCGKTTALRVIAGFERPTAGIVEIAGRRVASRAGIVPPERRRVGFVFQDFVLFPHLSVRENVGYGIRHDPDRDVRVDELLELVGLRADERRMPHELSGGMQQRVALARALAPRPDVVLFDEPFSNLDQAMRTQLRADVREVLRRARQTAIFVTHDQAEALTIADQVAVMVAGRIEQCATPEIVYAEPATPFVATFIGVANLVHAECRSGAAQTRFGAVPLVGPRAARPEGRALCLLRPEHFSVVEAPDGPTGAAWTVVSRRFSGSEILLDVQAPDGERVWVEAGGHVRRLGIGDHVELRLRDVETVAFTSAGRPASGIVRRATRPPADEAELESAPVLPVEPPVH